MTCTNGPGTHQADYAERRGGREGRAGDARGHMCVPVCSVPSHAHERETRALETGNTCIQPRLSTHYLNSKSTGALPRRDCGRGEQGHDRAGVEEGRGVSSVRAPPTLFLSLQPYLPLLFILLLTHIFPLSRKHAVETVETLDFLKEIVAAVPDPSAGGTVDLSADSAEKSGARKRAAKGKKAENEDSNGGAGGEKAPRRRRRKDDGEGGGGAEKGKGRGRGRAAANAAGAAKMEDAMDEDRPVGREEDEDYEDEGAGAQGRAHDDDEDWEG